MCRHVCRHAGPYMCAHMDVSVHVKGEENMHVHTHADVYTHVPVLTGGCGKEVVPELGSVSD